MKKVDKKFLAEYAPKDRMVTSSAEVNAISSRLVEGCDDLHKLSHKELTEVRNQTVMFYADLYPDRRMSDRHMSSMQSVTAVIDAFMFGQF